MAPEPALAEPAPPSTEPGGAAPPVEPPAVAPPAGGEEAGEVPSPQPGDIGEALAQLNQRFDSFEQRLPEPEGETDLVDLFGEDPEGEYEPEAEPAQQQQQPQAEEGENVAALRAFINEQVEAGLNADRSEREALRRSEGINKLGETFPELRDPQMSRQVRTQLEVLGLTEQGMLPDPAYVQLVFKALKADAIAAAEQRPGESAPEEGATLETGAGPGAPEPDQDPVEAAYLSALRHGGARDAFS